MTLKLRVPLICFLLAQVNAAFLVVLVSAQSVKPSSRRPSGGDRSAIWIEDAHVRLVVDFPLAHGFPREEIIGAVIDSLRSHCLIGQMHAVPAQRAGHETANIRDVKMRCKGGVGAGHARRGKRTSGVRRKEHQAKKGRAVMPKEQEIAP